MKTDCINQQKDTEGSRGVSKHPKIKLMLKRTLRKLTIRQWAPQRSRNTAAGVPALRNDAHEMDGRDEQSDDTVDVLF